MEFPEYDDEGNPVVPEVEAIKREQLQKQKQRQELLSQPEKPISEQVKELQNREK
jgi:hypothetical protein